MPDKKSTKSESRLDYWVVESIKDNLFEESYEIESEISSGPFGALFKCKPKGQKKLCCVKIIPKNRDRRVNQKEISHLLKLNHPNVARIYEIFETPENLYVITELLIGSDVLDRCCKKPSFNEKDAASLLRQILEGLKYIHEEDLCHANLKPENFLYQNDDNESKIKITDIPLYPLLGNDLLKHALTSSAQFCAPEILRNEIGNQASDMWSIGSFAYLLLCGEDAFKYQNEEEMYKKILKANYDTNSANYQKLSLNAKDFIMKLLTVDPKNRLNVNEALNNLWINGKATKQEFLSGAVDSMRVIVNKKKTQAFLNKQALRSRAGKPSLVQKYLPKDCWLWLQKSTKYGTSLIDCVRSAVENPDSSVGLYAPDPECYDTFPEIFWPVISDYHKVDAYSIQNIHDFGDPNTIPEFDAKYLESILSTRIRVGRSLEGFPMGPKLSRETREEIKLLMLEAFRNLQDDLYGDFVELNEMSNDERDSLIKSHYLFADADDKYLQSAGGYTDWPLNRGIFMNRSKTFLVWINEEDHVRIISIQKGCNIKQVYSRLVKGIKLLEKSVKFVYHKKFGYLTFCPTNIGSGLRASVHVRLPKLAASGKLKPLCDSLSLQARGVHGEHREATNPDEVGVFDISNRIRIGKSEFELVNMMYEGIKKLLNEELSIK